MTPLQAEQEFRRQLKDAFDYFASLSPTEQGCILHLLANRLDGDTAAVFADWLEENGRTEAGRKVRLLRPQPGDVLVLWPEDRTNSEQEFLRVTAESMRRELDVHTFVFRSPGQDLRLASPEQLRAAGWVREEEAAARVREMRDLCAGYVEEAADRARANEVMALRPTALDALAREILTLREEPGSGG